MKGGINGGLGIAEFVRYLPGVEFEEVEHAADFSSHVALFERVHVSPRLRTREDQATLLTLSGSIAPMSSRN